MTLYINFINQYYKERKQPVVLQVTKTGSKQTRVVSPPVIYSRCIVIQPCTTSIHVILAIITRTESKPKRLLYPLLIAIRNN